MTVKKISILLYLMVSSLFASSQDATITGIVTDANTKELITGAIVMLEGTSIGAASDFDGVYNLQKITPGTYTIRCSFISYETLHENVTISAGQKLGIDFALKESIIELGSVIVIGNINRQSENMILLEQKKAIMVTQAIGAQELSRKGVGDAEAAVTKISGISKQEGVKNVFVRGLGDRFNATTLNGFSIASEDPEYKNISLGFFSSDIISSIGVNKVFNATMNGDVGGASININSKELFGDAELEAGFSTGINSQTVSKNFSKTSGINSFGYNSKITGPTDLSKYSFKNSLDPDIQDFQINRSFEIGGGKKILLGTEKNPLRFYLLGQYSTDYNYSEGIVRNTTTSGTIYKNQTYDDFQQSSSHLAMLNADYQFVQNSLSYNALYIHTNNSSYINYFGYDAVFAESDDYKGALIRQQINDNTLLVNQLKFTAAFSDVSSLETGVAWNMITGNEPDRRINYFTINDADNQQVFPSKGTGRHQRYFSELTENDFNFNLAWKYKLLENSEIQVGYRGRLSERNFEAIEYDQQSINLPNININEIKLSDIFNQTALDNNQFRLQRNVNRYDVNQNIHSFYTEFTWQPSEKFSGIAGAQFSDIKISVPYSVDNLATEGKTEISKFYILPSLNFRYVLNDKNSLRLSASNTYTLPQAKEISPFRYIGRNFKSQGNPKLKPATNYNIDLKWDFYPFADELISVTGFFKYILDPISRVEKANAGGFLTYDNISDHTTLTGIEIEIRKNIIRTEKHKFSFGINSSFISTSVNLNRNDAGFTNTNSEIEGSAPLIINADLSHRYINNDFQLTNTIVFNYFSDRIYTIGTQDFQDIMEKGISTLDYVASAKLNKHWALGIKAINLLDPAFRLSREPKGEDTNPIILEDYKKGINMSLSISYSL